MKTCFILFKFNMFYVVMNFCLRIFKSVEVLEKNVRTFLFNKTCLTAIYVLAGRLRIQVPSSEIRILYDALRYRYKSLTGILLLNIGFH